MRLITIATEVEGERWDGHFTEHLREFIGEDLVDVQPQALTVRSPDGPRPVPVGFWLVRWTDGSLLINSPMAREYLYAPISAGEAEPPVS